jgi:hypothetical protein
MWWLPQDEQLLISKSCGDSNQCTPWRGSLVNMPYVWPSTIRISYNPCIATFRVVMNRVEQGHYSRERGLPTTSPTHRLIDLWVPCNFSPLSAIEVVGGISSTCWQLATRLTGPISPVCDQCIQYLLIEVNPLVLNRHKLGIQPWMCWLSKSLFPPFPTGGPPLST